MVTYPRLYDNTNVRYLYAKLHEPLYRIATVGISLKTLKVNGELSRGCYLSDWLTSVAEGKITLMYGNAGSGKTNICLWMLSRSSGPSLYISTEGTIPVVLLDRYSLYGKELYFKEVFSLEDLPIQLVNMYVDGLLKEFRNICVDSINAHYRYEAIERHEANRLLNTSLAVLSHVASQFRTKVLLVAQVREEEGEVIPSGFEILSFWSDIVIEVKRSEDVRELTMVKPEEYKGRKIRFKITERGIEFE